MKRRVWLAAVVAMALAVSFAAWFPGFRLERELAAARREGTPTTMDDVRRLIATVPDSKNAAPLIRDAIARDRAETSDRRRLEDAAANILKGKAALTEEAWFRSAIVARPDRLERWRKAADQPFVDYHRRWEDGAAVLFVEYAPIKGAARRLVAAARVGLDSEKNLLAAARLSALVSQEPGLLPQMVRVAIVRTVLREAKREGHLATIRAAFGPPIDVRRTLSTEPAVLIDAMRRTGEPGWEAWVGLQEREGAFDRLRHVGPLKANARYRIVKAWRTIWRELPEDDLDLEGAARALDRRLPALYNEVAEYSPVLRSLISEPQDMGEDFRAMAQTEREWNEATQRSGSAKRPPQGQGKRSLQHP